MPLNFAEKDADSYDDRFVQATATFRQPALETRYREQTLMRTQKQVRISLFFGAFFVVLFWLTDLATLGYNGTTQLLLAGRLLVALTVVLCFYLLDKYPQSLKMPHRIATMAELVAMCNFMMVVLYRPSEFDLHGMSISIMLLVMYLFIPNTFVKACAVALTTTGLFTVLALKFGGLTNSDMATMALALVFTNAFGILALHRQERLSRQEFQVQEIERRALATQLQFVAMLSHEFRTPLAIIDATVQRLGFAKELTPSNLAPRVDKIRRAVARILNLLENCLTEDRLAATELILHVEPVDLKALIERGYGEAIGPSSQRIRLVLPDDAQWVEGDRHLIDIALSNLVTNALKYSPEDTPVTITLQPDAVAGQIAIHVQDQGQGIRTDDREQIFDKFFRSADNQRIPGSGLGLHLARELARRHGGNVTLAPQSDALGAVFTLTLPSSNAVLRKA